MKAFAAYELESHLALDNSEGLILVKEGFCWPAAWFSLVWLFYHRLWLPALVSSGFLVSISVGFLLFHGKEAYLITLLVAHGMIFGVIGNGLREFFLKKSGYKISALVMGRTIEEAEFRFWSSQAPSTVTL